MCPWTAWQACLNPKSVCRQDTTVPLKFYSCEFKQYFLKSFSSRLAEYTDPKIRVDSQKKLNDKYTMVSSTLLATSEKAEIKIDWRVVTKNPDNPLIIDVIIEGVSLAKVQREEFYFIISGQAKFETKGQQPAILTATKTCFHEAMNRKR